VSAEETPPPEPAQPAEPTPAATPPAPPSTTAHPSQLPPARGGTAATPEISDWPAGKTGYTVVLESASSRSAAAARAKDLAGKGVPVGVLDSSGYASLTPDRFVVFSGQYASREEARVALRGLSAQVAGARVGRVAPA
jgi:septal ring-binding cell division protein DamX